MAAVLDREIRPRKADRLDRAAICLSAACLAHCLAVPLLLVIAPWLALGVLGEEWFHLVLVALVVPLSLLAFKLGHLQHGRRGMLGPGLAGLALVALAAILEFAHIFSHEVAAALTSVGGVLLIFGHWRNLRARRCTRSVFADPGISR